ncbi:MAG: polysaccharide deacetylase family protein [Limisphaerales bacterium]
MSETLPSYYTTLAPFRERFRGHVPILTYHKFGERPRGVRLRGMYLPTALFERQLREFAEARFESAPVAGSWEKANGERVVLTIDDGFRSVHEQAMPLLARTGLRATLYLVAGRIGGWNDWEVREGEARAALMTVDEVRDWLASGHRIGAHSMTHPWLTKIPREAAREEIRRSRKFLEDKFGVPVTDFCYPYGDWNEVIRGEVVDAGYETATTTDFGINGPDADRWALRRITARHSSRGVRGIRAWWRSIWGQGSSLGSTMTARSRKT